MCGLVTRKRKNRTKNEPVYRACQKRSKERTDPTTKRAMKLPKTIGEYTVEHLLETAQNVVKRKTGESAILDVEAEARIPKFDIKGKLMKLKASRVL